RINLGGLYVQPELLYNSNTYSYEYQFPTGQYTSDASSASVRNATLELPVMVGFKILFLRLEAGPSFTLGNWDDIKSGDLSGLGIDFKSPVTGYQAGLGAEFGKFSIGLRYAGYFSRTEQTFTLPDHTTQQLKSDKNGRFMLSLGYFF
ncbi:MAG: PorT family protein, partial [Rikenellaceae bacterium]|nr:PorT family protein [Rikenellaceae bacterium]